MQSIRVERDGTTAALLIDRAERRNALTQEMWSAVPDLLAPLQNDDSVRVLTVRSTEPGVFCAGADITEYRDNAGDVAWGERSQERVERALSALRAFESPTVALIDGACIGGGAGIALACDFRIASTRSSFGFPPAKLGLVFPVEDTVEMIRVLGPTTTKRLLFTGTTVEAAEALRTGLVDALAGVDDLEATWNNWKRDLTSTVPGSVRSMKRIVSLVQDGLRAGNDETRALVAAALEDPEHHERVRALVDRSARRVTR